MIPYAFTWEVPGGAEWRFTAHAYPFYFVAIAFVTDRASRLLDPAYTRAFAREAWRQRRRTAFATAAVAAAVLPAIGLAAAFHFLRLREATAAGAPARIDLGARGAFVFAEGWSGADGLGRRTLTSETATLRFPLRRGHAYDAELCLEAETAPGLPRVTLNKVSVPVKEVNRDPRPASEAWAQPSWIRQPVMTGLKLRAACWTLHLGPLSGLRDRAPVARE